MRDDEKGEAGTGAHARILSIQSAVAYGHVGNSAAVFPLQRLGAETWPIDTVQFSNHTGYGAWTGEVHPADAITALVDGIAQRGVLPGIDAVLSGYVGDPGIARAVVDAARRVREANPAALYACDPVIGDVGRGVFVRPGIVDLFAAEAVPAADILTPNHFELGALADGVAAPGDAAAPPTLAAVKRQVASLRDRMRPAGRRIVVVTSLVVEDTGADAVEMLVGDAAGFFRVRTPRIDISVNGAGDVIAALILFHVLRGRSAAEALAASASSVWGVIERTRQEGRRELALVAAQEELVAPSRRFPATPC